MFMCSSNFLRASCSTADDEKEIISMINGIALVLVSLPVSPMHSPSACFIVCECINNLY